MHLRLANIGLAITTLAIAACGERTPPPGSGALETTPTGSAARPPEILSVSEALACPDGAVLTVDPKACRLRILRGASVRWDHELVGCGGVLDATVALDSTLYVRDPKSVSAFDPEGTLRWVAKLRDPSPPHALAVPAVLADSRVALLTTAKTLVVYDRDGKVSWTFSPPTDEVIVAAPTGMKTEGLVLMTSHAVYYLSAMGEVRWRAPGVDRTAEL